MADRLSPKRKAFVQEYMVDLNATQAAIRAGYSTITAKVTGHRLLTNDNVIDALSKAQERKATQAQITAADVLKMLHREATAGDVDQPNAARIKAQELIGKHIGMFTDKVQVENVGAPPEIRVVFGQAKAKDSDDAKRQWRALAAL